MVKEPGSQSLNGPQGGQLRFVLYDQSSASGSSHSRQVRSHAARSGWSVRKQKWKVSKSQSGSSPDPPASSKPHASLQPAKPTRRSKSASGSKLSKSLQKQQKPVTERRTRSQGFLETVMQEEFPLWTEMGNTSDPFSVYPVQWNPVYAPLLEFWDFSITPGWLSQVNHGWDKKKVAAFAHVPLETSIVTSEPSAFYGIVALSAAVLPPTHPLAPSNTPQLTSRLVTKASETLNAAMDDPARGISNPTIVTVISLASIALFRGQMDEVRNVYLPAFKRMVELRGGLEAIARETDADSLLPLWIAWGDSVLTSNAGVPPLFPEFTDPSRDLTDWNTICGRVTKTYTVVEELEDDG